MSKSTLLSVTDHFDDDVSFICSTLWRRYLDGGSINIEEAGRLIGTRHVLTLAECANMITRRFAGEVVDVETLINAKSLVDVQKIVLSVPNQYL